MFTRAEGWKLKHGRLHIIFCIKSNHHGRCFTKQCPKAFCRTETWCGTQHINRYKCMYEITTKGTNTSTICQFCDQQCNYWFKQLIGIGLCDTEGLESDRLAQKPVYLGTCFKKSNRTHRVPVMGPIYNCILTCSHGLGLGGPIQLESFLIIILDVWSRANKGSMFGIRNCKCYKKITTKSTERGTKTPSKCIPPMWSQASHKDEHNCRSTCTHAIGGAWDGLHCLSIYQPYKLWTSQWMECVPRLTLIKWI